MALHFAGNHLTQALTRFQNSFSDAGTLTPFYSFILLFVCTNF